jgi:hypothetical protein
MIAVLPESKSLPNVDSDSSSRVRSDAIIAKLKRFQALETMSFRLLGGWLPGVIRWETKHEIGLHIWQDAQHSRELRTRLWELRVQNPDRGLDENLLKLLQGLACAQKDFEFLGGLCLGLKSELIAAYRTMMERTHPIYDAPTVAILQRIVMEKESQVAWAKQTLPHLADSEEKQRQLTRWTAHVHDLIKACGGVDGSLPVTAGNWPSPPPGYSCLLPFGQAHRDERFKLSLRGMELPDEDDRKNSVIYQFVNYAQEMQAAETLGSVLWEAEGMEWEFYYDIARHCYDEERHSALGDNRLRELGHHVTDFPHSAASYAWKQLLDPLRRYCLLTCVQETDGFKYKHKTYQEHLRHQDIESAEAVLFDIMDETMHVRLGQKWTPKLMERYGYQEPLDKLVSECRTIMLANSVSAVQIQNSEQATKAGPGLKGP